VRDGSGQVVGAVGTVEDVTVRRRAEAALRASEARLAGIIASATDAIITTDAAHRIVLANAAAEHAFGYAVAELIGQPVDLLLPERCRATHREHVARLARAAADARAAGEPGTLARVELAARRRDGGEFPIEASISRVVTDEGAFYTVILRDVSERRRAEAERERLLAAERAAREEAQARRREADEANAAKSRFLATTSHEIRTPINAILGYTELLEMGLAGPLTDEQGRYLARLRLSGRHLLGVVNQVLDLSKIEADKVVIRPRAARAADAAARAAALVEPQAAARGVALANACGGPGAAEVAYHGDPERVEQVLVNLVTNAVKFTRAGGRVTVSCGAADAPPPDAAVAAEAPAGWTYLRVDDTGIGVPPERLRAIWEPFEQADVGHTRAYGGTGLGLTISRRLARLMGGDVTVRSEPGAGSTFVLWLPAAPPPDPAGAAALPERRRADTRLARGLGRAADAALAELEGVLSAYTARLRTDPETPSAWALPAAELEDHTATFLAEVARCLTIIEAARGAPSESMRDGSAIQRVIAERHGAQRARLGWAEGELRREFTILREELAAAVRRRLAGEPDVALDQALTLIAGFLDRAERTSVEAHRAPPPPGR
jgi:PAS domain S-box-containing protein